MARKNCPICNKPVGDWILGEPVGYYCKGDNKTWTFEEFDRATRSWENIEFPVWVEHHVFSNRWDILKGVMEETGIDRKMVPDNYRRRMRTLNFSVWFKVTETGVEGPYLNRDDK